MTDITVVNKFIDDLKEVIRPGWKQLIKENGNESIDIFENFEETEYYFRQHLYNEKKTDEELKEMLERFKYCLVDAGEVVGLKSALCMGEALTQAALDAIHSIGGGVLEDRIIRAAGLQRFQELFTGAKAKHNVITLTLYDDSYEATKAFANEQETFYMCDIITKYYLKVYDKIEDIVLKLHPKIDLASQPVNYNYAFLVVNARKIAAYSIHIADVINAIRKSYKEIAFMTALILNANELGVYVYFNEDVPKLRIQVILQEWKLPRSGCIIHGRLLKNCYVSENKSNPGHYVLEANDVNPDAFALENLIYDERVNPFGCKTTNMQTTYELFGVCEATARLHEEILFAATNLSDTREILPRHYKMIADNILANGSFKYASRNSLKKDSSIDPMRLISFEIPVEMLQHTLKNPRKFPIGDQVSASFFGELPRTGTGVSKINMYVTNE